MQIGFAFSVVFMVAFIGVQSAVAELAFIAVAIRRLAIDGSEE
jgi:hypothetical protein